MKIATFAAAFREIVMPDLQRHCRLQGLFLALDRVSFSEAADTVMREAISRGGARLTNDIFEQLDDWIATAILRAEAEFSLDLKEQRAMADRVAIDIRKCEAAWRTTT